LRNSNFQTQLFLETAWTEVENGGLLLSRKHCCRVWNVCQGLWFSAQLRANHL